MTFSSFFSAIFGFFKNTYSFIKNNKRLNILLTIISVIYPFILIILSWDEIKELRQIHFDFAIISIFLYLISALIQFLNWILILRQNFFYLKLDFKIYSQTILMQRLPGGFWQWLGRIHLYNEEKNFSNKRITTSIIFERIFLIFTGAICYIFFLNPWIGISFSLVLLCISTIWSKEKFHKESVALLFSFLHFVSYIVCWILGALILFYIAEIVVPLNSFSITEAISIWSLTGIIGLVFFFIPSALGVRELSLSTLLMPLFSFSEAILISLLIRILFFLSDLILATIGFLLFKRKEANSDNNF